MRPLLSLFHRELLRLPNKKFFYPKRIIILVITGAVFIISFANNSQGSAIGLAMYRDMVYFLLFSLIILTPMASLDLITSEKENRTLELLWLTDLSPLGIIVSKYFSRVFTVLLFYLSALPLILFCVSLGGISGQQIFASTTIILGFIFFGTAVGLVDSTICQSKDSSALSILIMVIYLVLSLFISDTVPINSFWAPYYAFSPFHSMSAVLSGKNVTLGYYNCLWQSILALFMIFLTTKILPKIYLREIYGKNEQSGSKVKIKQYGKIVGNPIAWYDYRIIHGGKRKRNIQMVICCLILVSSALFTWGKSPCFEQGLTIFWTIVIAVTTPIMLWILLVACWRSFIREKQRKNWFFILATDLSPKEIMRGKAFAIYKTAMPYYYLIIAGFSYFFIIAAMHIEQIFIFIGVVYFFVMTIFAICSFAMYSSLRNKTMWKAATITFLYIVVYIVFIPYQLAITSNLSFIILFIYFPCLAYMYNSFILGDLHHALDWI